MRLLRLATQGFGRLRGQFRFDPDRVVVVVDDNERGKTTMLAAVAAALYGLEDDRRSHRLLTPLDRWRPWEGAAYDVELEVECSGERYTVTRDFSHGRVEVRDSAGQDVTAEFREGRDEYPVGTKLAGLDAAEFEKCALVRQGELVQVVPGDEKERRGSPLRARLEAAADSHLGDTSATEALRALDTAWHRYTCPELEFTGTVENALQRLAARQALLETEIKALEHDWSRIAAPLDQLADLEEEEASTRGELASIEAARRTGLAADARRELEDDRRRRDEVHALRREAESLAACAGVPPDAEGQLREAVARLESSAAKLKELEARRAEQLARERQRLEEERDQLKDFESGTPADADQCVALAAELRRVAEDDACLRDEIFTLRESLATEGHDVERLQWLSHRLSGLGEADQALLRRQSEIALAHQTEVAGLQNQRTENSEVLRAIDAQRNRWGMPGWFLLALGLSGVLAGFVVVALQGLPVLSTSFFVAGALMFGTGVTLVTLGRQLRGDEREEALRMLSDAQRRLNQLRQQRAETESALAGLARGMGYRDHVELLREWNEVTRLREESAPTHRAQEQLAVIEARRQQALERADRLLRRFGVTTVTPESLETAAARLRTLAERRHQLATLGRDWSWMEEQETNHQAEVTGLRERALHILQSAGLSFDPGRSWEDHLRDLAARSKGRGRHATLVEELIPRAEQQLLSETRIAELENRLVLAEGEADPAAPDRTPLEIEGESRRLRERLDRIQQQRGDLRVLVEEFERRYRAEHPEKRMELERVRQAHGRASRFRAAVELASSTIQSVATATHRRWADYLNHRVGELLAGVGTGIGQIRFGDDLDFKVTMADGQSLVRGKADQQLSCAARDQLYLAVRLAICEFLSRGRSPLPLLLDDVFATSDDERARAGMRLLIERFTGHQVILMTCHRQRYERLAELDRELYQERVQWLDAGAASLAT